MNNKNFFEIAISFMIISLSMIIVSGCRSGIEIISEARNLCEESEGQVHEEPPTAEDEESMMGLQPSAPALTLHKVTYKRLNRWGEMSLLPDFLRSRTDANTIVCISQSRRAVATYESGAKGYRISWTVQLIGYPDGKVFASKQFESAYDPPKFKAGASDIYGDPPNEEEVSDWIFSKLKGKKTIRTGNRISDIALSPDGESLAIADGKNLQIWDVATETLIHSFDELASEKIAFSPDGKLLAGNSKFIDDMDKVWLFDVKNYKELPSFEEEDSSILTLAFSPDSKLLATGNWDGVVKIWDVDTRQIVHTFQGNKYEERGNSKYTVVFLPDGNTLMGGGEDRCLKGWNVISGENIDLHPKHEEVILCGRYKDSEILDIAISSDGTFLAKATRGESILIYDTRTWGAPEAIEGDTTWGKNSVTFLSGGSILAGSSKGNFQLWDVETTKKLGKIENEYYPEKIVAFPDGKSVAYFNGDTVRILNVEDLISK